MRGILIDSGKPPEIRNVPDTAQCTGCPYLLPWGPDKYVEGQGFHPAAGCARI